MKKLLTLTTSALLLTHSLAQESDPFQDDTAQRKVQTKKILKNDAKQIRVYFETVEISSLQLAELMSEAALIADDTKLRQAILQQCKDGKAKLLNNHLLTADEDATTILESIKEFIYPTEYEPPSFTNDKKKGKDGDQQQQNRQNKALIPPHPTAFETRNIGFTVEVTASILAEKNKIKLNFNPEYVTFLGFSSYGNYKNADNKISIVMPEFSTKRSHLNLTLENNKFLLISTHQAGKADDKDNQTKQLTFIRASILKSPNAK